MLWLVGGACNFIARLNQPQAILHYFAFRRWSLATLRRIMLRFSAEM